MPTCPPLLNTDRTTEPPRAYLEKHGRIFAEFGERTQDSGNISYGVECAGEKVFVKTAGRPDHTTSALTHAQRVDLLRNAVRLSRSCSHPALVPLLNVIESPEGPLLVYAWAEGSLLRSVMPRFHALPAEEILRVLDAVYELHRDLARLGWVASDFYDGGMLYDFETQALKVMDLDSYHPGPFVNEMGRLFGSSRFMAPEEYEKGALIDERTTVFTMGRTAAVLLSNAMLGRAPFRGNDALFSVMCRACQPEKKNRFASMAEFHAAWRDARDGR